VLCLKDAQFNFNFAAEDPVSIKKPVDPNASVLAFLVSFQMMESQYLHRGFAKARKNMFHIISPYFYLLIIQRF
jgi:hypothetical protein